MPAKFARLPLINTAVAHNRGGNVDRQPTITCSGIGSDSSRGGLLGLSPWSAHFELESPSPSASIREQPPSDALKTLRESYSRQRAQEEASGATMAFTHKTLSRMAPAFAALNDYDDLTTAVVPTPRESHSPQWAQEASEMTSVYSHEMLARMMSDLSVDDSTTAELKTLQEADLRQRAQEASNVTCTHGKLSRESSFSSDCSVNDLVAPPDSDSQQWTDNHHKNLTHEWSIQTDCSIGTLTDMLHGTGSPTFSPRTSSAAVDLGMPSDCADPSQQTGLLVGGHEFSSAQSNSNAGGGYVQEGATGPSSTLVQRSPTMSTLSTTDSSNTGAYDPASSVATRSAEDLDSVVTPSKDSVSALLPLQCTTRPDYKRRYGGGSGSSSASTSGGERKRRAKSSASSAEQLLVGKEGATAPEQLVGKEGATAPVVQTQKLLSSCLLPSPISTAAAGAGAATPFSNEDDVCRFICKIVTTFRVPGRVWNQGNVLAAVRGAFQAFKACGVFKPIGKKKKPAGKKKQPTGKREPPVPLAKQRELFFRMSAAVFIMRFGIGYGRQSLQPAGSGTPFKKILKLSDTIKHCFPPSERVHSKTLATRLKWCLGFTSHGTGSVDWNLAAQSFDKAKQCCIFFRGCSSTMLICANAPSV